MARMQKNHQDAVLAIAEIKEAVLEFDRGDSNIFDALERIEFALQAMQSDTGEHLPRKAA